MNTTTNEICPKCLEYHDAFNKKKRIELSESYGKIHQHDWEDDYRVFMERCNRELPRDLNVSACFSINPAFGLYIHYKARCNSCGFSYEYVHKVKDVRV